MFVESEMGEPLGLLQVTVIQGKKLVIRDFKSSDPYVIVKLGNEVCLVSVFHCSWQLEPVFVFLPRKQVSRCVYLSVDVMFYCFENQSAKTKVINNCLNPVWNEELNFTLKDPAAVLALVCLHLHESFLL